MCSTYGEYLKLSIFGQSHGAAIGACLDGIPAGLPVDMDALAAFLGRRAPGRNAYSTPRKEAAAEEIQAGDQVKVDFDTGVITDITTGKTYQAEPFPEFIQNIIRCGGLLASLKEGK